MKFQHKIAKCLTAAFLLGSVTVLTGCEDFLQKDVPNDTTEEEWWQTVGQLNTALNSIYKTIPSGLILYQNSDDSSTTPGAASNTIVEREALTDNCIGSPDYINFSSYDSGTVPTSDILARTLWFNRWRGIRRACRFLENYHRAFVPTSYKAQVTRMAAEARACRAFYHLDLFLHFGNIPIVETPTLPSEQELSRESADRIVSWITAEFETAAGNLPVKGGPGYTATEAWRWTQDACYAYMSYLYLYVGDWANAKKWASKVIDEGRYQLMRVETDEGTAPYAVHHSAYSTLFIAKNFEGTAAGNNTEAIFIKNNGAQQVRARLAPYGNTSGGSVDSPTASLVNEYELLDGRTLDELDDVTRDALIRNPKALPRDPRLEATVLFPNENFINVRPDPWTSGSLDQVGRINSSMTGYWVKKWGNYRDWVDKRGDTQGINDFYLMRYAVVLLNYVEAAIELNQLSDENIYTYLNDIRTRAGMPEVDREKYKTQEKLRELVRRERRVELAFEGHRLFDIRRWKIGTQVMNGPVLGAYNPNTGKQHQAKVRVFNERDYLWPIPAEEISMNPNMEQNPGY